jgi:pimeloyl-ACP methyl ester carboxylesterase
MPVERPGNQEQDIIAKSVYADLMQEKSTTPGESGPDTDEISAFNRNRPIEQPTGTDTQMSDQDRQRNPDFTLDHIEQPADQQPSEKLKAELKEHHTLTDPETGKEYTCLKLNWPPAEGQVVRLMTLQWSQSTESGGATAHTMEQAALQLDGPVVVINNPGMAGSSKTDKEQRKQLRAGDIQTTAASMLRAVCSSEEIKELEVFGYSQGGREAAAMLAVAPDLGIKIDKAVIMEAPGAVEFSNLDLISRPQKEGEHLKFYQTTTRDAKLVEELGDNAVANQSQLKAGLELFRAVKPDLRGNVSEYIGMAKANLGEDLLTALVKNPDLEITLIGGGASQLVPKGAYYELREEIVGAVALSFAKVRVEATGEQFDDAEMMELYEILSGLKNEALEAIVAAGVADGATPETKRSGEVAGYLRDARRRLRLQMLPGETHSFGEEGRRMVGYIDAALN